MPPQFQRALESEAITRSDFAVNAAFWPAFAARCTAMLDWNAMGVETSRMMTSTKQTSMSGVMFGSWIASS
jgi:hypothetical protein